MAALEEEEKEERKKKHEIKEKKFLSSTCHCCRVRECGSPCSIVIGAVCFVLPFHFVLSFCLTFVVVLSDILFDVRLTFVVVSSDVRYYFI